MKVRDLDQRNARSRLQQRGGRIRFVGEKPYSQLQDYARAADVAVLPYRKCEPTYSGSSTRFYEHLAAGHPILSTRGFEELLHKEPLLRLVDSADEMIVALDELRMSGFRDGHEHLRRLTSQSETWELRAATMQSALYERTARRQVA
jgi:glycosyltransferase involved in cell wall biosynthesis